MATSPNKTVEAHAEKVENKHATNEAEHPVDARLQRLTADTLPKSPYILTPRNPLGEEHVRNQYPQNTTNWRRYSPFRPGEEELQHVTYDDRSNALEIECMYARKGRDDGNGRIAASGGSYNRTSNDGTPRQGQPPKKKITLAEYKNKDRSKAATSAPRPAVPEQQGVAMSDAKVTVETKDVTTSHAKVTTETKTPKIASQSQEVQQHGRKRSAESMNETNNSDSLMHSPSLQPLKKARAPDEPKAAITSVGKKDVRQEPQVEAAPGNNDAGSHKGMPYAVETSKDVASHTIEKTEPTSRIPPPKKSNKPCLPPMLSPLSSAVEEEIAKFNRLKASKAGAGEKPATVAPQRKTAASSKVPQGRKEPTSASGQKLKDADPKNVPTPKASSHGDTSGNKAASTPGPKTTPPQRPKGVRLKVALKIRKKANKKHLVTYLNLKPTPGRNSLFPNKPIEQEQHPAVPKSTNIIPNDSGRDNMKTKNKELKPRRSGDPKVGDKRRRSAVDEDGDEPEPSVKRKQFTEPSHLEKPKTPKSARTSSPAPGSAATLRAASAQGSVRTPQPSIAAGTPTASSTGRPRRQYTSPNKPKSPDLRSEAKDYIKIARKLKYSADVLLKTTMSEKDRKEGLVLATESVLCFMFVFVLSDTSLHYSDRTAWNSIIPFLTDLQALTTHMPSLEHMSGLLHQLEATIRDQVAYSDLQVVSNTDPAATTKEKCQELHSHFMKAQAAWRIGWVKLDVTDLPAQYPETWAKRGEHRFAYGKGRDAVMKGEYQRKYLLPMNHMTSGLEAVNFGMNFMKEWCKLNEVEWEPSLVLDRDGGS